MSSQIPHVQEDPARAADMVQDSVYYYPTGDVIIRAENTLFRIHKLPLIQNSPVFAAMLATDGEVPTVATGDRAEDFRGVLKYIYASPIQVQIDAITMAALPEIISLARLSDKYEMKNWKQWALLVLTKLLVDLHSLPVEQLSALYSLYHRLEEHPMRDRLMKQWCAVLELDELPIGPVLDAADACEDKDALAEIYCIQIRRWEDRASLLDPQPFTEEGVSPIHAQRILSGHASLSLSWSRLRASEAPYPLPYEQCQGGNSPEEHENQCIPFFRKIWVAAIAEAERQYPDITEMASRLAHIGGYLEQNIKGSTTNERRCFEVFTMVFDLHLKQDAHWLASHFIPRLPLDTSTFANQGNEGKKRKATMETEREGGGGERTVSKDCKVLGSNDSNESMESNPGALRVREWRHKLQKTFLPSSAVLPKEDDMPAIDTLFKVLEIYGGMNVEYLNFSKIGKIMRHINLLPPNRVPRDDEFHFRDRAGALVNKWHKLLNSNSNSTDAAETEVTVKAESATEHTARMDVDGPGTGGADDSGSDLEWDVVNSSNKRMRRE